MVAAQIVGFVSVGIFPGGYVVEMAELTGLLLRYPLNEGVVPGAAHADDPNFFLIDDL